MQNMDDHLSEHLKEWDERKTDIEEENDDDLKSDSADNKIKSRKEDCDEK